MKRASLISWVAASLLLGCGGGDTPKTRAPAPSPPVAETTKAARDLFVMRCAPCHGKTGKGDGPTAAGLKPKPRDFSLDSWHRSMTAANIKRVIIEGGIALGMSPIMPANPDLRGRPHLVVALVRLIRSFKRQPATQPAAQP